MDNRLTVEKDEIIRKLYAEEGRSIKYGVLLYVRYFAPISNNINCGIIRWNYYPQDMTGETEV